MEFSPMLATSGKISNLSSDEWAFEGKWDGYRMIAEIDHGKMRLISRSGRIVTEEYPQLKSLADNIPHLHVAVSYTHLTLPTKRIV